MASGRTRGAKAQRLPREERERLVLDTAADLFYARGVHEVGMDELIREAGVGKATVYRLFPTKDDLIAAYLRRAAGEILALIDADIERHEDPRDAVRAIFAAIASDVARPGFRGCAFNNASIEFADPQHPARVVARDYRAGLHARLVGVAGDELGSALALVVDGMYTSGAHLGPGGPAAAGPALAEALMADQ